MALYFLKASFRFYNQAEKYENENSLPNEDYNAFFIGGLISSASFIECYINEIFTEIWQDDFGRTFPIEKVELIKKMWEKGIPRTARYRVLEKYDILLDFLGFQ